VLNLLVAQETIASYKNRELDSCHEALLAENKQLCIENNNIPVLQSEVEDLKKRLAAMQIGGGSSTVAEANAQRVQALEVSFCQSFRRLVGPYELTGMVWNWQKENASLKREIARLKQSLHQHQQDSDRQQTRASAKRVNSPIAASGSLSDPASAPNQQTNASEDLQARLGSSTVSPLVRNCLQVTYQSDGCALD
jgi:hypothetical protein